MANKPKHDSLIKKIMASPIAEFLTHYLPEAFKEQLDLTKLQVEQESYVEENHRQQFRDMVYSVKPNQGERLCLYPFGAPIDSGSLDCPAFVEIHATALQRQKKNKEKLPIINPIVIYNGTQIYNAPETYGNLYRSRASKKALTEDYLCSSAKHVRGGNSRQKTDRDAGIHNETQPSARPTQTVARVVKKFKVAISVDKENEYIDTKTVLWYTKPSCRKRQFELEQLLNEHLFEEKDNIMRTIAQAHEERGIKKVSKEALKGVSKRALKEVSKSGKPEGKPD